MSGHRRGGDGQFVSRDLVAGVAVTAPKGKRGGANRRPGCYDPKPDGWTEGRRATFLAELAISSNVTKAVATTGLSARSAYAKRNREPAFRAEWQAALEEGYFHLELELLHRARFGDETVTTKTVGEDGAVHTVQHGYSNTSAVRLLTAHRGTAEQERERTRQAVADPLADEHVKLAHLAELLAERAARDIAS